MANIPVEKPQMMAVVAILMVISPFKGLFR